MDNNGYEYNGSSQNMSSPKYATDSSREQLEVEEEGDENKERGNWTGKLDFILSCLGYAVGLGNVWRFPYICFKNGGGAFLIPYVIMLLFVGLPLFYMELSFGQFASLSPIVVFGNAIPLLQGIGYGMVIVSFFVGIYYNMIIAWTLFYLFASFTSTLPWDSCHNDWNTKYCYNKNEEVTCQEDNNGTYYLRQCLKDSADISAFKESYFNDTADDWGVWCDQFLKSIPKNRDDKTMIDQDKLNAWYETGQFPSDCNFTSRVDMTRGENSTWSSFTPNIEQLKVLAKYQHIQGAQHAAAEYFERRVLKQSAGIHETGKVDWELALCLLLAWVIVYLCLIKGIKSSGKVVYFTATFPYVVILILLVRGFTLEGFQEGIKFYMVPNFETLKSPTVWSDAAGQIFFSLGNAFGGLMTLASYNRFNNNCLRDSFIVAFGNCITSIFAGFAIFSILGFMATELGREVPDIVDAGTGLAFIAYPTAVTRMPVSPLWAILFFFMLLTLGLDSQFVMLETVLTAVMDMFPEHRKHKSWIGLGLSIIMYILGMTLVTSAGLYWLDLMNAYAASWSVILIALAEGVSLTYIYGGQRLLDDFSMMLGSRGTWLRPYWLACWYGLSPVLIIGILGFTFAAYQPLKSGSYVHPDWSEALGWMMALLSIIVIPIFAVINVLKYKDDSLSYWEKIIVLLRPVENWGPYLDKHRTGRYHPVGKDNEGANYNGDSKTPGYPPVWQSSGEHTKF